MEEKLILDGDPLKAKLLLEGWTFEPIKEDDDVYTMEEWISICKDGGFIDYDGMGDYAINGEKAMKPFDGTEPWIYPSYVTAGKIDKRFTHVVWYNR